MGCCDLNTLAADGLEQRPSDSFRGISPHLTPTGPRWTTHWVSAASATSGLGLNGTRSVPKAAAGLQNRVTTGGRRQSRWPVPERYPNPLNSAVGLRRPTRWETLFASRGCLRRQAARGWRQQDHVDARVILWRPVIPVRVEGSALHQSGSEYSQQSASAEVRALVNGHGSDILS